MPEPTAAVVDGTMESFSPDVPKLDCWVVLYWDDEGDGWIAAGCGDLAMARQRAEYYRALGHHCHMFRVKDEVGANR